MSLGSPEGDRPQPPTTAKPPPLIWKGLDWLLSYGEFVGGDRPTQQSLNEIGSGKGTNHIIQGHRKATVAGGDGGIDSVISDS